MPPPTHAPHALRDSIKTNNSKRSVSDVPPIPQLNPWDLNPRRIVPTNARFLMVEVNSVIVTLSVSLTSKPTRQAVCANQVTLGTEAKTTALTIAKEDARTAVCVLKIKKARLTASAQDLSLVETAKRSLNLLTSQEGSREQLFS
jgi:hypothetical protein